MVNYECKRCGYVTKHKGSFINHLERKNICAPLLEDMSIEMLYEKYNLKKNKKQHLNDTQTAPFDTQMTPFGTQRNSTNSTQKTPKQHPTSTQTAPKKHLLAPKKNMCEFCEKTFTRKTGLTKHLKCCKQKKIFEDEKDIKIEFLEKEKEIITKEYEGLKDKIEDLLIELSKNGATTTNNNSTTNMTNSHNTIHNTININNYGNENTDYLKGDYLNNLLQGAFTAIPKLIENIHFNPQHPENHNIKITNKKEPYIKVRKNDKWELQDKKETLETLVDDKYYLLEDHYGEVGENGSKISGETKRVMDKFIDKYSGDKELQKDLQKKSEIIILNNS
jgi:hypothetical protein